MVRAIRLNVFLGDECIGYIDDLIPPAFRYAPAWLARDRPLALAAIPLSSEPQQAPEAAQYEPGSWSELATRLGRTTAAAIDLNGTGARISLAGAQDKASIALFDGKPYLPRGTAPSTYILKPDIRRLTKVWYSAANETLSRHGDRRAMWITGCGGVAIGGETRPGSIGREHVLAMARSLGMQPAFALREAADLARKMPVAVERAMTAIMPVLPSGARPMAEKLARFILSTTKKTAKRPVE